MLGKEARMLLVNQRWYTPTLVSTSDIDFWLVEIVSKWTISQSAQETFWIFLSLNPYSVLMSLLLFYFFSLQLPFCRNRHVSDRLLSWFSLQFYEIVFVVLFQPPQDSDFVFSHKSPSRDFLRVPSLLFHLLSSNFFISLVIFIFFIRMLFSFFNYSFVPSLTFYFSLSRHFPTNTIKPRLVSTVTPWFSNSVHVLLFLCISN